MQSAYEYNQQGVAVDKLGNQISPFKYTEKSKLSKNTNFVILPSSSPEEESPLNHKQFTPFNFLGDSKSSMSETVFQFNNIDVVDKANELVKSIAEKEKQLVELNDIISQMQNEYTVKQKQQQVQYTEMQNEYAEKFKQLKIAESKIKIDQNVLAEKEHKVDQLMKNVLEREKQVKEEETVQLAKSKELSDAKRKIEVDRIQLDEEMIKFNSTVKEFKKEKDEYEEIIKQKIERMHKVDQALSNIGATQLMQKLNITSKSTDKEFKTGKKYDVVLDMSSYDPKDNQYTFLSKNTFTDLPGTISIKNLVDNAKSLHIINVNYTSLEAAIKDDKTEVYQMLDVDSPISLLAIENKVVEVVLLQ